MDTLKEIDALMGPDREGIRMIMVSTLTGSAAVDGNSQGLGNATDAALFHAMRRWADVAVVGSGTVRAEDYHGTGEGEARLAVLSYSLELDTSSRLFTSGRPPLILTPSSLVATDKAAALVAAGAELVDTGEGSVADAVAALRRRGFKRIACEGGPGVYSSFIRSGLLDQLYLTLDPRVDVEATALVFPREGSGTSLTMELENVATDADSTVFLRYRRALSP